MGRSSKDKRDIYYRLAKVRAACCWYCLKDCCRRRAGELAAHSSYCRSTMNLTFSEEFRGWSIFVLLLGAGARQLKMIWEHNVNYSKSPENDSPGSLQEIAQWETWRGEGRREDCCGWFAGTDLDTTLLWVPECLSSCSSSVVKTLGLASWPGTHIFYALWDRSCDLKLSALVEAIWSGLASHHNIDLFFLHERLW